MAVLVTIDELHHLGVGFIVQRSSAMRWEFLIGSRLLWFPESGSDTGSVLSGVLCAVQSSAQQGKLSHHLLHAALVHSLPERRDNMGGIKG